MITASPYAQASSQNARKQLTKRLFFAGIITSIPSGYTLTIERPFIRFTILAKSKDLAPLCHKPDVHGSQLARPPPGASPHIA